MDVLNALVLFTNFVLLPATAYGAQLALGALGVTLIFGILRFANFSHGELMSFGAMITILVTWWLQAQGVGIHPLPTALIALPVGVLAAVALALSVDRVVFRFYRRNRSSPIIFAMTSVGVMFVIAGLIRLTIGPEQQAFADGERFLFTVREFRAATGLAEGIGLRQTQVITIVVAVLVMLALFLFLQRARFGKAMRAYADNEDLALLSGINPERVVAVAWIIAASLAAIGATLYSLDKVYQPFHLPADPAADLRRHHPRRHRPAGGGDPRRVRGRLFGGHGDVRIPPRADVPRPRRLGARGTGAIALDQLQVRRLVHHPRAGAADPADRGSSAAR
jgi:branched-chain amino acid transport system permease protein